MKPLVTVNLSGLHAAFSMLLVVVSWCPAIKAEPPYPVEWARQFGTIYTDRGTSVATDSAGNAYISGYTYGNLARTSFGGIDAFLKKYDSFGSELWTRQLGTPQTDSINSIAIDENDYVYISGTLFDGFRAHPNVTKLDGAGQILWSTETGTSSDDISVAITVDKLGNSYITGYTEGANASIYDAFFTKFDASGNVLWTRQVGLPGSDLTTGIELDSTGNIYVSGRSSSGPFLAKFNPEGGSVWSKLTVFGTSPGDRSDAVTVDQADNVYVSGTKLRIIDNSPGHCCDVFLIKYDAAGNEQWGRLFAATTGYNLNTSVSVDQFGNSFITGLTSASGYSPNNDVFLAKYDPSGTELWRQRVGSADDDRAFSMTVDMTGNVYVGGVTYGNIAREIFHHAGDPFLVKFTIPEPHAALICASAGAGLVIAIRRRRASRYRV